MKILFTIKNIIKSNKFLLFFFKPIINLKYFIFFYYKRNQLFNENGELVLLQAKKALDSINLKFWLDFGTLLGAYRDGKLIRKDLDIDLGVFLKDYSPEIEQAMRKFGFKLISEYEIDNKEYGLEQTYEFKGVFVDLFYYNFDTEKMWCHLFMNHPNLSFEDSLTIKGGLLPVEQYLPKCNFTKINFLNTSFTIPDSSHDYLSFHYGEDYKTPRKWNYMDLENDNKNTKTLVDKVGVFNKYY